MTQSAQDAITCPHCGETIPVSIDLLNEVIGRQLDARLDELRADMDEQLPAFLAKLKSDAEVSGEE